MLYISEEELEKLLDFASLIPALEKAFQANFTTPLRHHHSIINPEDKSESVLLLMPAWDNQEFLGVKMVTVHPGNKQLNLPAIQGNYTLFNQLTGELLAMMDAKKLTAIRTAAASALASKYLSRHDASSILMVGTGVLAPQLIKAHCLVRPIQHVYVWGRNKGKAQKLVDNLKISNVNFKVVDDLDKITTKVDIISCATSSNKPLIFGRNLRAGQHIDLVGSFKPNMREADDALILKSHLYVDTMEGALKETGDIVIPLSQGLIDKNYLKGDLFDLCNRKSPGRIDPKQITTFKSVGHALEDLVAAKLVYHRKLG